MPISVSPEIARFLQNPFVLQAAWRKTLSWYRSAEWAPEPEFDLWQRATWPQLVKLADELANGTYVPDDLRMVPYPKQGARIRNYYMPTIRDQVAHMVFAVLLAPFLEARFANVAYGSRWNRGLRQRETNDGSKPKWSKMPFSLADSHLYIQYKRDYSMYRRLAQWTVSRFLAESELTAVGELSDHESPEQYDSSMLPYIRGAYRVEPSESVTVSYARLDLQKAYPSVSLADLERYMLDLLQEQCPEGILQLKAPWGISRSYSDDFLGSIIPDKSENNHDGLENPWAVLAGPMGESMRMELANYWLGLLNRLQATDKSGYQLERALKTELSGDKVHVSGIPTGLAVSGLLMQVALSKLDQAMLGALEASARNGKLSGAYLRFVDDVILLANDPAQLTEMLRNFQRSLDDLYSINESGLRLSINWNKVRPKSVRECEGKLFTHQVTLLDREIITRERRGEFVTDMVERLSELQEETLLYQRTQRGFERLSRLLELSRWNIQDAEVRADTRYSFALNALTRAWFPEEADLDGKRTKAFVKEIRGAAKLALEEAPWKPGLWRAVIRAGLRPMPGMDPHTEGKAWLQSILSMVAKWENEWPLHDQGPEVESPEFAEWTSLEDTGFRKARVSFLRSTFWREIAKAISDLVSARRQLELGRIHPEAWYVRVLGADVNEVTAGLELVAKVDDWAAAMYPNETELPWWEIDALAIVKSTLEKHGFTEPTNKVFKSLTPIQPEIDEWTSIELRLEDLLECKTRWQASHYESLDICLKFLNDLAISNREVPHRYFSALVLYRRIRHLILSEGCAKEWQIALMRAVGVEPRSSDSRVSLYQLLWGVPSDNPLESWGVDPTRIAALGLPREWALKIFGDLLTSEPSGALPEPYVSEQVLTLFSKVRRDYLSGERAQSIRLTTDVNSVAADWSATWSIPPHPIHLVAGWRGWNSQISSSWHSIFALFLALDGSEEFHDSVFYRLPAHAPWSEVMWLRSKQLLPKDVWREIDFATGVQPTSSRESIKELISSINLLSAGLNEGLLRVALDGQYPVWQLKSPNEKEQVEIREDSNHFNDSAELQGPGGRYWEIVRLLLRRKPQKSLGVRIAQLSAVPDFNQLITGPWPNGWNKFYHGTLEQIDEVLDPLLSSPITQGSPNLVVFPELTIPPDHANRIARDLASRDIGMIGGMFWREIPNPIRPRLARSQSEPRYFVNEAIVSIPNTSNPLRYPFVMTFPKPRPANIEYGLQDHFLGGKKNWRIVPGKDWLSFEHEEWGPFAVAVCSDILDPEPWAAMKAEILHLFLVAWNPDVELYKAMTRARAYELYVNLVAVNHGDYGGSLAWTPQSGSGKLLFAVEGRKHFVCSDVSLDVVELARRHARTLDEQHSENAKYAAASFSDSKDHRRYKSVPLTPWPIPSSLIQDMAKGSGPHNFTSKSPK